MYKLYGREREKRERDIERGEPKEKFSEITLFIESINVATNEAKTKQRGKKNRYEITS